MFNKYQSFAKKNLKNKSLGYKSIFANWGKGPGLESGISYNDPGVLQDYCVIL